MKFNLKLLAWVLLTIIHTKWIKSQSLDNPDENISNDNDKKSTIFDSYVQLTPLEDYHEVCDEYSDEDCAQRWLNEINEIAIKNVNRLGNVEYQYSTKITRENSQLLNEFRMKYVTIERKVRDKIERFKWKSFQNPDIRRKFQILSPTIQSKNESITRKLIEIKYKIYSIYNKARPCWKVCLRPGVSEITQLFQSERDYDKLSGYWTSWRNVTGAQFRHLFIDKMILENIGAKENGYNDAASFIVDNDFDDEYFKDTVINLYESILPLYKELHGYVRYCLLKHYPGRFDSNGPIPAHLFGNVWGQQWTNIFPIIKNCSGIKPTYDYQKKVNDNLQQLSVKKMFEIAEQFYESIGMYRMTDKFWERSVLEQPADRIVNCHGSAHDLSNGEDFRIKMCTKKNINDFTIIHHEMGHIEYFMAYRHLPILYRGSANPGFHESIGDTIALSVKTPKHLYNIGLIDRIPQCEDFDIDYLMITALERVVFLPFALTMDSYIWGVYNGSVPISDLNKHWWDLRYKYQGLKPPVERSENDFDPGSKYHIAFGISYIRYFVSFIIQFQFYESMCKLSGHEGPLHRCDFNGSEVAGSKLLEMLKQGKSQHWKETLKILTGTNNIESKSLLKYFQPLYKWLIKTNKELNIPVGW